MIVERLVYSLIIEEIKVTAEENSRRISTSTFDKEDIANSTFEDYKQQALDEAGLCANNITLFTCEEVVEGKELVIKLIYKSFSNSNEKVNITRRITKTEGRYFFEEEKKQ